MHKTSAELLQEVTRLKQEKTRTWVEFLNCDLDLCFTFAETALNPKSSAQTRKRNRINARKGYDSLTYFSNRSEIPASSRDELKKKLKKLKSTLKKAGERFDR